MIKLFVSDVDGVLTDGSMYYSESGDEIKRFSTYDGMAFSILKDRGIKTAVITSENTKIVSRRCAKMNIDFVCQGLYGKDKLTAVEKICNENSLSLNEVSYIGDDINCCNLLKNVGYKACPSNARPEIKNINNILKLKEKGGNGVVREYVDYLINKNLI
jgi:3-deoxy-D-manno-octulosonate 8-phosphate phosphatase (KDO 8-P phosphatase)